MRNDIGIPHTLKGLKVGDEKAKQIAEMAIVDPTASGNPIALDVQGARRIFDAALNGDLKAA